MKIRKILHLSSTYFPHHTGGKEVFVHQLAKNLMLNNFKTSVLIHDNVSLEESYEIEGIPVYVLPQLKRKNYRRSYFSRIYDDADCFKTFLVKHHPDIVHFHDQGDGASLTHFRICKALDIKTLVTYHSPGQSCMQRALTYAGKMPCDGKIIRERCASCMYQIQGIPESPAKLLGRLKLPIDKTGMFIKRNSVDLFYDSWNELYNSVDAIQVHAHWVESLLKENGIHPDKIHFIEMGGHESLLVKKSVIGENQSLKLVFIGRCTDIKGIHLLIDAVKQIPEEFNIEVHFFSPSWEDSEFGKKMLSRIQGDERFKLPELVPSGNLIQRLSEMDISVIPSLWPETGPFTVFDAFAAGLPVIGTNHAGIAERVMHGEDGLLFEWNSLLDLKKQIMRLLVDRDLIEKLRSNIKKNRTFNQMSSDFINLYKFLIEKF